MTAARFDLVIPTLRRPSLSQLLLALDTGRGPAPGRVIVVDDRPRPVAARGLPEFRGKLRGRVEVLSSGGRGLAAARNLGWRASSAPWIAFLDDDVVPPESWLARLHGDLAQLDKNVAGSQGRMLVPAPAGSSASSEPRSMIGLESTRWIAADMAYRRSALELLGGFDEGFTRATGDASELAIRALRAGYRLLRGRRNALHPVRQGPALLPVRTRPGDDDAPRSTLNGVIWRRAVAASGGRLTRHITVTTAALASGLGMLVSSAPLAWIGAGIWLAGTLDLAFARALAGPRTAGDIAHAVGTSVLIPPRAVLDQLQAQSHIAWLLLSPRLKRRRPPVRRRGRQLRLVLFDRDVTSRLDRRERLVRLHARVGMNARRTWVRARRGLAATTAELRRRAQLAWRARTRDLAPVHEATHDLQAVAIGGGRTIRSAQATDGTDAPDARILDGARLLEEGI